MFKKLFLGLCVLAASLTGKAQTLTYPALQTDNIFTGHNTFLGPTTLTGGVTGLTYIPITYTVATLPAASGNAGVLVYVSDGLTAGTCTAGSGTNFNLCYSNGSNWLPAGGGSGSSITFPAGILVGTGSTSAPIVGTSSNITSLFSGCASSTPFLGYDGTCKPDSNSPFISPKKDYGAKGDGVKVTTCATTATSAVVTCTGTSFSSADIGKIAGIPFAGATDGTHTWGQTLFGNIVSVQSATQITLSQAATFTIVGPRTVSDTTGTVGSTSIGSATASFTQSDVGKKILLPNCGEIQSASPPVATQPVMITGLTSSSVVTVNRKCNVGYQSVIPITAWSVSGSNIATITNSGTNGLLVGQTVMIAGLSTGSFLNGSQVIASVVSNTSFTFAITHATASGTEAGTATPTSPSMAVTIPGATLIYGTDDTTSLQNAATASATQKRIVLLDPNSMYTISASIVPASNMSFTGHGPGSTIAPVGQGFAAFQNLNGTSPATGLYDVHYTNFEIDATGVVPATYSTANKAIYTLWNYRAVVDHMYIHDTFATAIGMDFNPYTTITNNTLSFPGYGGTINNAGAGGAGIGLGTGKTQSEPQYIAGNHISDFGIRCIFVEGQSGNILSSGARIIGNDCRYQGLNGAGAVAIGDHGTQGTIIADNTISYCYTAIDTNLAFAGSLYSLDYLIEDNHIENCGIGILIFNKTGGGSIRGNSFTGFINQTTNGATAGASTFIDMTQIAGGTPTPIVVQGNTMRDFLGRGVFLDVGAFGEVSILNNSCKNPGTSGGTQRACFSIEGTATAVAVNVDGNIGNDDRGSQGALAGFLVGSGTTITRLYWGQNDFGRLPLTYSVVGTVTNFVGPEYTVHGSTTLVSGSGTATWGTPFGTTSSYQCRVDADSTTGDLVTTTFTNVSTTTATITGTGTDTIKWSCSGR